MDVIDARVAVGVASSRISRQVIYYAMSRHDVKSAEQEVQRRGRTAVSVRRRSVWPRRMAKRRIVRPADAQDVVLCRRRNE